jgi:hypothetical protein
MNPSRPPTSCHRPTPNTKPKSERDLYASRTNSGRRPSLTMVCPVTSPRAVTGVIGFGAERKLNTRWGSVRCRYFFNKHVFCRRFFRRSLPHGKNRPNLQISRSPGGWPLIMQHRLKRQHSNVSRSLQEKLSSGDSQASGNYQLALLQMKKHDHVFRQGVLRPIVREGNKDLTS